MADPFQRYKIAFGGGIRGAAAAGAARSVGRGHQLHQGDRRRTQPPVNNASRTVQPDAMPTAGLPALIQSRQHQGLGTQQLNASAPATVRRDGEDQQAMLVEMIQYAGQDPDLLERVGQLLLESQAEPDQQPHGRDADVVMEADANAIVENAAECQASISQPATPQIEDSTPTAALPAMNTRSKTTTSKSQTKTSKTCGMELRSMTKQTTPSTLSHFGSHTIISERINKPVWDVEPTRLEGPLFSNAAFSIVKHGDARIQLVDHQYRIRSNPIVQGLNLGVAGTGNVDMNIGGWIPDLRYTIRHDIVFTTPYCTGSVDPTAFEVYLTGGQVTDRAVGSVINSVFNNQTTARAMSGYFLSGLQRYSNISFYTKGLFYSLLLSRIEAEGLVAAAVPFGVNVPVNDVLVIPGDGGDIGVIGDAMLSGAFTLFEGYDFNRADLDLVYWLAATGRRIMPGAIPSLACMAIHWPAISFFIVRTNAQPFPIPPAAMVNSTRLWDFVLRMARNRSERDQFVAAYYEASILVNGVLMRLQDGEPAQQDAVARPDTLADGSLIRATNPDMIPPDYRGYVWYTYASATLESYGMTEFPRPRDYNGLHRLIGIRTNEEPLYLDDYCCFANAAPADRLLISALFSGVCGTMITTILHSWNIYGGAIHNLIINNALASPQLKNIMWQMGLSQNIHREYNTECFISLHMKHMLVQYFGGMIPKEVMAFRSWNVPDNGWAWGLGPYALEFPHHPPRLGNPLAIFEFLDSVPCEWGVFESTAKVDFTKEVNISGGAGVRGWYATNGEPQYENSRVSSTPYNYVPYGALAMNALCQSLIPYLPQGNIPWGWQLLAWDLNRFTPYMVGVNPHPPDYMINQHIYQPCTINTYNWELNQIVAPIAFEAAITPNGLRLIYSTPLGPELGRGFVFPHQHNVYDSHIQFTPSAGMRRPNDPHPVPTLPNMGRNLIPSNMQANNPNPGYGDARPF